MGSHPEKHGPSRMSALNQTGKHLLLMNFLRASNKFMLGVIAEKVLKSNFIPAKLISTVRQIYRFLTNGIISIPGIFSGVLFGR